MKFCSQCFNDTDIKSIIETINNQDICDITGTSSAHIYDTDKHKLLTGNFELLLNTYTPISELGDKFDKANAVKLKYDLSGGSWDIFNPVCKHTDVYNILKNVCSEKYNEARELFDEDVIIQEVYDVAYNKEHSLLKNYTWEDFTYSLKHNNRFHSSHLNLKILEKICATSINKHKKGEKFYRGRISQQDALPKEEMGAPPIPLTADGRVNSAGIQCLCLSSDIKTTINEVRAGIFDYITVGTFELLEDITVVDFRIVNKISPFIFDANGLDLTEYVINRHFLNKINDEMGKSIRKNDSKLDYVPTQYICDYIKSICDKKSLTPQYMGVEYNSTLCNEGYNLAIFKPELFECVDTKVYQVKSLEYNTKPKIT